MTEKLSREYFACTGALQECIALFRQLLKKENIREH
jgi:hypothetical protein